MERPLCRGVFAIILLVAGYATQIGGESGTYLVICNVRQHFLDGMFAFVKVKKDKH
jgi:hypothetical protein